MTDTPITLRRARPANAADYARLMGDPAVFPNLMQLPLPSEEPWRARLEAGLRPGSIDLALVAERGAVVQRFGFRVEGTHRGYALRDGVYADVLSMARLHPGPPRLAWPESGP